MVKMPDPRRKPTAQSKKHTLNKRRSLASKIFKNKNISYKIGVFTAVLCALFLISLLTNKNAYEVYVGETLHGTIKKTKSVSEETLFKAAEAKLSEEVGAKVRVNEKITLKPKHAKSKNISTPDYVIGQLYNTWKYEIEASVIVSGGKDLVYLKTDKDVGKVLEKLSEEYSQNGAKIVEKKFEKAEVLKKFVSSEKISSVEKCVALLSKSSQQIADYTIEKGDTLWQIAQSSGMKIEDLITLNDGMTFSTPLIVGKTLKISINKPTVSIRTVEEITYVDVSKKQTETVPNASLYKSYKRMIKQGKDGQKQVVAHIIRVDGFEVDKQIVSEKIIDPPISEVIEIGVK